VPAPAPARLGSGGGRTLEIFVREARILTLDDSDPGHSGASFKAAPTTTPTMMLVLGLAGWRAGPPTQWGRRQILVDGDMNAKQQTEKISPLRRARPSRQPRSCPISGSISCVAQRSPARPPHCGSAALLALTDLLGSTGSPGGRRRRRCQTS
jgi:hypothetical protein